MGLESIAEGLEKDRSEDITQERMEKCQGGLPGRDAAYIAYSNKSKVLKVESLGKVCSVCRWQSVRKVQGHTGKSMEPCMEAARSTDLQLRAGLWIEISGILAHRYHCWQMTFLGSASWRF